MLIRFRGNGFANLLSSYSFGSHYLYSSSVAPASAPTHILVKYLVDSLGFSKEEAASTSSKVTSRKTLKNPDLVLNFLKETGLDKTQMKTIVSRVPKLLFRDVSKTLKPKFHCLMDLGLSGADLASVIAKDSQIIDRGLDTHLRPTIDCLRRILGSDENVVKALKRFPWLLTFRAHHIMETNLLLLKNCGLPDERIRKLALRNPSYLAQNPERISGLLNRVENDFLVPRDSPSFLYGFQVLSSQSRSKLDSKFGIFKSFGWSDDDVLQMFQKLPFCVALSEARIQKALNLFMKECGFEIAYLVSHPAILCFSLGKRVVPRMQVLKILDEKKVERRRLDLYYVLSLTEAKFIDYFVLLYEDQLPDLYEQLKKIVAP